MIVSYRWVVDMVQSQRRLPRAPYELVRLEYPYSSPKKRGLSSSTQNQHQQRTRFTIRELIKIFWIIREYPSRKNKNQVYWLRFIKQGFFPGRSVNSVNAQWQRFCHYDTIEQAIQKAYQLGMPYSQAYPQLPAEVKDVFEDRIAAVKQDPEASYRADVPTNLSRRRVEPPANVLRDVRKPKRVKTERQVSAEPEESHVVRVKQEREEHPTRVCSGCAELRQLITALRKKSAGRNLGRLFSKLDGTG